MDLIVVGTLEKSRLRALPDHFSIIDDPRGAWRVAHPLAEVLLLVVRGTICDCDDFDGIADWGEEHPGFLRRCLPISAHCGIDKMVNAALTDSSSLNQTALSLKAAITVNH